MTDHAYSAHDEQREIDWRCFLQRVIGIVLVGVLSACHPDPHSPQGVAEGFLDAHYVWIDLQKAKTYCTGLALSRIEEEIRLTEGVAIDGNTRQPKVYYKLLKETPRGKGRISFQYEATVTVAGVDQFRKEILLTLGKEEADWRVVNYTEFD